MGRDQRLAAIDDFIARSMPVTSGAAAWQPVAKGMPKASDDAESDDGDEDEDDDATDADDDDESDEEQDDSSDDEDDDSDDADDEDDEESEDDSKGRRKRSGFRAPKSQAEFDRMIARRLERKEREVETKVRAEIKREEELKAAKKKGDSDKVIKALEDQIAELKRDNQERSLDDIKRRVAERAGLPPSAAARLVGKNEAEIRADAKALRKELGINPADRKKPDDRGESNKARPKSRKNEEQEDWRKPGFFIQEP